MEALLLAIGFIGVALAILTPLKKIGALTTLVSFVAYFAVIGISEWLAVILFSAGLLLIVFEIFVPEFGAAGIIGTVLLVVGLYWTTGDFTQTIRDLSVAIVFTTVLVIYLVRKGYSIENVNKLILFDTDGPGPVKKSSKVEESKVSAYPGLEGVALTPLRPSGKVVFGEESSPSFDVLSSEGHISKGTPIVIEKVSGTKITVRKR